jgi:hypothetical protein
MNSGSGGHAVSEVLGSVVLIGMIVTVITVAGVIVLSKPLPPAIPALTITITNTSSNLTLRHDGGEPLRAGDFRVMVNNADKTADFTSTGNLSRWSVGDTMSLNLNPSDPPRTIAVVYTGDGSEIVLISRDLSGNDL